MPAQQTDTGVAGVPVPLGQESQTDPEPRRADRLALVLVVPLAVLLTVIILVFYVFFSPLRVDGPSMEPTLLDQDVLLMTRDYQRPERGDVIATSVLFQGAPDDVIKRVIGLPGDTVEIRGDIAYVNGAAEPDRGQLVYAPAAVNIAPQVIPADSLWVMGDNRAVSADSRIIGPVAAADVTGRAVAIFSPVTRIRLIRNTP